MSPVDDPILQNGEECGASSVNSQNYFPRVANLLQFQNGFEMIRCVVDRTLAMTQMS